jgi:hypothetical protein
MKLKRTICLMGIASLTCMAVTWATTVQGAALEVPESQLDSRTVPRGDWVQVSGEVQQTMTVRPDGEHEQVVAMLQPVEGGQILVDLGPAANLDSVRLQDKDYIHVRGTPLQQGESVMIVAGELIADGKVIPIQRDENQVPTVTVPSGRSLDQIKPHPAAPAPPAASAR